MRPVHQDLFGAPDAEVVGNCYPACIASLLECDLSDVPHVYQLHRDNDAALTELLAWLQPRGFTIMCHPWGDWVHRWLNGALVIMSGKSPRGDWSHAVIGRITADGWSLVHDPHPDGTGIVGEPETFEFIVKMMREEA